MNLVDKAGKEFLAGFKDNPGQEAVHTSLKGGGVQPTLKALMKFFHEKVLLGPRRH